MRHVLVWEVEGSNIAISLLCWLKKGKERKEGRIKRADWRRESERDKNWTRTCAHNLSIIIRVLEAYSFSGKNSKNCAVNIELYKLSNLNWVIKIVRQTPVWMGGLVYGWPFNVRWHRCCPKKKKFLTLTSFFNAFKSDISTKEKALDISHRLKTMNTIKVNNSKIWLNTSEYDECSHNIHFILENNKNK